MTQQLDSSYNTSQRHGTRVSQLDFMRGVAIIMVLGAHPTWAPQFAGTLETFAYGWSLFANTAVDSFFVLSGFLVGGMLLQEWKRNGTIDIKRFLLRRGFKIWPAYFSYIIFLVIVYLWEGTHGSTQTVLLTFLPNFVHWQNYLVTPARHTWSLATEEHYYLFLPFFLVFLGQAQRNWRRAVILFIVLLVTYAAIFVGLQAIALNVAREALPPDWLPYRRNNWLILTWAQMAIMTAWVLFCSIGKPGRPRSLPALTRLTIGVIVLCLLMRIMLKLAQTDLHIPETLAGFASHTRLDIFFIGILIGYWYHFDPARTATLQRHRNLAGVIGLTLLLAAILLPVIVSNFLYVFSSTFLGGAYGGILLVCVLTPLGEGWFGKLLASRVAGVIGWLGIHSYSIYLWHINPFRYYFDYWLYTSLARHFNPTVCWTITTLLYGIMSMLYGAALSKLVELPMLRLRDRFFPARATAMPVTSV